jgi:hypothetical protein
MSRSESVMVAIVPAGLVLLGLAWFDSVVLGSGDDAPAVLVSLGALLVAVSVLLLGAIGWASRSRIVGGIYVVAGSVIALLPVITHVVGTVPAGGTPLLPESLMWPILMLRIGAGPLEAVTVAGAAMAISGIAGLARATDADDVTDSLPTSQPPETGPAAE